MKRKWGCTPGKHPLACTLDHGRACLLCREVYAEAFARENNMGRGWLRRELGRIRDTHQRRASA